MTRKPRVLLDIDGCVADFITPVVRLVNDRMGTHFTVDDVTDFDLYAALGVPEDVQESVNAAIASPGFCASLEPYPDAIAGVAALRGLAEVRVVTSPWDSETWMRERERWVARYLGIPRKHVIHSYDKIVCAGATLIDDRADTVAAWDNEHHDQESMGAVLFTRPWNARASWLGHRAASWPELISLLEGAL